MKLTKILAIALASVVAFASCGPQQVEATGDAAVGFASETLEYGLGSEYIKIPIVTTGETSVYPIKVTVDVAAYSGDFAAVEDVDYLFLPVNLPYTMTVDMAVRAARRIQPKVFYQFHTIGTPEEEIATIPTLLEGSGVEVFLAPME